ncbi:3-methyladenine DNA glycosylase [Nocardioides sp.]|uniref:3-methyladenine DNA glycosylase n=1 Tax=Nocardioides sp. TaxID=35761 RepID=UPI003D11C80D
MTLTVLDEATWAARAAEHAARVDAFVAPHLARRADKIKHPVHDFLFTYYSQRPAQLRRWHPGFGVGLAGGAVYAGLKGYVVSTSSTTEEPPVEISTEASVIEPVEITTEASVIEPVEITTVSREYVESQRPLLASSHALLTATAARAAHTGCFGLHEWAMVYRSEQTRHDWPLRLGAEETDRVVESHRIVCSHFDAFRFFTPPARVLNVVQPTHSDRVDFEQPGCLHAGMDLYKHAFRLTPLICSDLVADCFDLALDIRVLDMRAAPYDLTDLGYLPVRIETPEGKQEYAAAQRGFAERGAPLRQRLIDECERLLARA